MSSHHDGMNSFVLTVEVGHTHANIVDRVRESPAAPKRISDGRELQKKPSLVRAENSVRKSEMETFRYITVVTCPYESFPIPMRYITPFSSQEFRHM